MAIPAPLPHQAGGRSYRLCYMGGPVEGCLLPSTKRADGGTASGTMWILHAFRVQKKKRQGHVKR